MNYRLGLVGYPLDHSISPALHSAGLVALELSGEYIRYPIPDLPSGWDGFEYLVNQLKTGELDGLNVTIPYKQIIIQWLDVLTPTAKAIGAVNTLYCRVDKLVGDNTDAGGFLLDLERVFGSKVWPVGDTGLPGTAMILGAGGSAWAVAYSLNRAGWRLALAARNISKAEDLAVSLELNTCEIVHLSPEGIKSFLENNNAVVGLVVNTTPLGMFPDLENSPWPIEIPLPVEARIYDLVYNPRTTRFVLNAQTTGHRSANGLGMLVEQAALALEIWTGQQVPRQPMYTAAEQALNEMRS